MAGGKRENQVNFTPVLSTHYGPGMDRVLHTGNLTPSRPSIQPAGHGLPCEGSGETGLSAGMEHTHSFVWVLDRGF